MRLAPELTPGVAVDFLITGARLEAVRRFLAGGGTPQPRRTTTRERRPSAPTHGRLHAAPWPAPRRRMGMLAALRVPKLRYAGRRPRTRGGPRCRGCARAGTSSKLCRHVDHIATVTDATGRLPQAAAAAGGLLLTCGAPDLAVILDSAGDAASARRRVAPLRRRRDVCSMAWPRARLKQQRAARARPT